MGQAVGLEDEEWRWEMKKGWQTKTLGDTCEMYQPKTISGKDMLEDGAFPVFGANGIIGRYNKFNHEETQHLTALYQQKLSALEALKKSLLHRAFSGEL